MDTHLNTIEPKLIIQRKLSIIRLLAAFLCIGLFTAAGAYAIHTQIWKELEHNKSNKPWFAAYVDVTATPTFQFQQMGTTSQKDAILSFIVSLSTSACTPSWGSVYTLDQANNDLDLDTRIARLQQKGGSVAISFGGQRNNELAVGCTDSNKLQTAYQSVIDRYNINTIDLDLEGSGLINSDAQLRRADALAQIQSQMKLEGKNLAIWVTLPVTPNGLTQDDTNSISDLLAKNIDIAGINIMTMDYGSSLVSGESILTASEGALLQTEHQVDVLYQLAGIHLSTNALWQKIGATPMIGQNDDTGEIFTLDDARALNTFALSKGMGRMSMWSANRDITCGSNYINTNIVSDSCSGIDQGNQTFMQILSSGFQGNISLSAGFDTTTQSTSTIEQPDNPAASPYQIWSETGAYPEGTKVVWHHNIYQAKWWTQGDIPDNPVLQTWQTPWQLIGPVLPGETPIPQPTLPEGTYPDWSGTAIYNTSQRVLLNGVPYEAKWWNQGNSPAQAASDPSASPWLQLTQSQINALLATITPTKTLNK